MALKIEEFKSFSNLYRVDMVKRNDGCDIFIIGVDDFQPVSFYYEQAAIDWILEQKFGKYTITKIYCMEP